MKNKFRAFYFYILGIIIFVNSCAVLASSNPEKRFDVERDKTPDVLVSANLSPDIKLVTQFGKAGFLIDLDYVQKFNYTAIKKNITYVLSGLVPGATTTAGLT